MRRGDLRKDVKEFKIATQISRERTFYTEGTDRTKQSEMCLESLRNSREASEAGPE